MLSSIDRPAILAGLLALGLTLLLLFMNAGAFSRSDSPFASFDTVAVQSDMVRTMIGSLRLQLDSTRSYNSAYQPIDYPMGDVPLETGVCADVVVRTLRSIGTDLQEDMHQDMKNSFSSYPRLWGLDHPDRNIDHRRVANQITFLRRQGKDVGISERADDYRPGDIVAWMLPGNLYHIGIVTNIHDRRSGNLLIAHNIGRGVELHDALFAWEMIGHFRWSE